MHIDDGFAALEFVEDHVQDVITEIHAIGSGEENKAIELEDVERVRSVLRGGIDTG